MRDVQGRGYLKLSEAKAGDIVELDGGFTCHKGGTVELHYSPDGLYFYCDEGRHFIRGQADDDIHCIGIYPA
jgi:hypothetical protein